MLVAPAALPVLDPLRSASVLAGERDFDALGEALDFPALLRVARTFRRAGVDLERVPFMVANALQGIDQIVLDDEVLTRAAAFEVQKLGTLGAIHLATAQPLAAELDGFLTYDGELMAPTAAARLPL